MANTDNLLEYAMFAETFVALSTLALMGQKRLLKTFKFVGIYLAIFAGENAITTAMLFFRKDLGFSKLVGYNVVFYTRWVSIFLLAGLSILIIQSVFSLAMNPMKGLHRVGKLIFRWIFAVSALVSIGIAISPHVGTLAYFVYVASHLHQATSVLTLCLLLFVCFSIRQLGLTYRSHIFGVSLGMGVISTVSLIESAWFNTSAAQSLYSPIYLFGALGSCAALLVWGTYFALPEPAPKMVLLPTTSPYFLWNSISETLGDDPGHVAVAGFKPHMLSPGELEVISLQGSAKQRQQEQAAAKSSARIAKLAAEDLAAADKLAESAHPAFAMQP
jgi:hypothetical protein